MILIVDDDDSVRDMMRRVLVGEGYKVATAADGAEAMAIAAVLKIDLVLLDIGLPDMSGWDTFERMTRANPSMAVVVITARSSQKTMARAAGVGALLEKPLDFPALLRTVAELSSETPATRLARLTGRVDCHYYGKKPQETRSKQIL
jgi:DNA-binding response OmpR family regulator